MKLVITATDHDHGFKLDAFQIDQLLKKGEATTVEFTADHAGTFPFECSHFCGLVPGWTGPDEYRPAAEVATRIRAAVAWFAISTLVLASAFPFGSVTAPTMLPVPTVWARSSGDASRMPAAAINLNRTDKRRAKLKFKIVDRRFGIFTEPFFRRNL